MKRIHRVTDLPNPVLRLGPSIVAAAVLAVACSTGAAPTPAGNQNPPGAATPAGPAGGAGGATNFHMVVADGPKAGTYDISTTDPGACSVADVGYFVASYLETGNPGLDYISATLHPGNRTGLVFSFDSETDAKVNFVGTGTVTVNVDDRGQTATMRVTSDENVGSQDVEPLTVDGGQVDLTVECASVLRPNPQ
jgi:hypothetical protein